MNRKIINVITVSRIVFGLLFAYIVLFNFNLFDLSLVFILCALSDFFDGKLAKEHNLDSDFGSKLDVMSDFIFIIFSTFSLVLIDLLPFWFLFIIIIKLLEFFISSSYCGALYYEKLGHIVALMFYILPILAAFINSKSINLVLCIFITILALISSLYRIYHLIYLKDK